MEEAIKRAVGQVIVSMRENLGDQLTIDDMARTAMFSKFHFSRIFQQATGVSPGRFLSAVRFQKAKELLVSTSLTVTDISHRVGYTSVGTFSSRFRRSVGVSPTTYRQMGGFSHGTGAGLGLANGAGSGSGVRSGIGTEDRSGSEQRGATVRGDVWSPQTDQLGLLFVGLFADRIPRSQPVRCTVLHKPGAYVLEDVPLGTWYLLAHSVAAGLERVAREPLGGDQVLCVGLSGPIKIRPGTVTRHADVRIGPMRVPDPPVLNALLDMRSVALSVGAG